MKKAISKVTGFVLAMHLLQLSLAQSAELTQAVDTLWALIAAVLVMFMQAGFALLEAGLLSVKNTISVLLKNYVDFSIAALAFWALGFGLMFGAGNDFFGMQGFFLSVPEGVNLSVANLPLEVFYFFHLVFAATAATIVSGAVAGRIRFSVYVLFSITLTALIYPTIGHWVWGGGWLARFGFIDFAGASVVHVTGGFAALAAVFALGPRLGRFEGSKSHQEESNNLILAGLGVFILWLGWFGFNGGSTFSFSEDPALVGRIIILTNLGAAAGGLSALLISWRRGGEPNLPLTLNGVIGGLVSVTAAAPYIAPLGAIACGIIAGSLVIWGTYLLDVTGIDDAVGASVAHGLCGIWGTVAVGLFGLTSYGVPGLFTSGINSSSLELLSVQTLGTLIIAVASFAASYLVFVTLSFFMTIRSSKTDEISIHSAEMPQGNVATKPDLAGAGD